MSKQQSAGICCIHVAREPCSRDTRIAEWRETPDDFRYWDKYVDKTASLCFTHALEKVGLEALRIFGRESEYQKVVKRIKQLNRSEERHRKIAMAKEQEREKILEGYGLYAGRSYTWL